MNKSIIYLLYFTLYTLVLLFFGKGGFKRTETRADFYIASGSLGISISIFTFIATWLSAASVQGFTGSVFYFSYSPIIYAVIPWFIGALMMFFLVKRLRSYGILTVPEYFNKRYKSNNLQILSGIIIIVIYILYIIIQIRGFGIVMSQLLGINYTVSIFLVYLFIVYTSFGGLFSVAKTDGMNFFLMVSGILIAAILISNKVGGISQILSYGFYSKEAMFNFTGNSFYNFFVIFSLLFGWGLGLAANPQYIVRICSAKDDKTAYKMIIYSLVILLFIYFSLFIIGMGGRILDSGYLLGGSGDEFFPNLIDNIMYTPFSGFILISIVASAISTANSQLLIVASACCNDIIENFIKKDISEDLFININRIVIVFFGSISLFLSINPPQSLLIFGSYLWGIFTSSFFIPLYGGLLWKKGNKFGAYGSMIGGLIGFLCFFMVSKKFDIDIHPGLPGFIISMFFYIVFSIKFNDADLEIGGNDEI